jgi:hypothetical protein
MRPPFPRRPFLTKRRETGIATKGVIAMSARIFSPARTAMQSGKAKTGNWVLEFEPEKKKKIDPLMGYTTSGDMKSQIRLVFDTREEAEAYAKKNGIAYRVEVPKEAKRRQISYAENFRYDRKIPWTH